VSYGECSGANRHPFRFQRNAMPRRNAAVPLIAYPQSQCRQIRMRGISGSVATRKTVGLISFYGENPTGTVPTPSFPGSGDRIVRSMLSSLEPSRAAQTAYLRRNVSGIQYTSFGGGGQCLIQPWRSPGTGWRWSRVGRTAKSKISSFQLLSPFSEGIAPNQSSLNKHQIRSSLRSRRASICGVARGALLRHPALIAATG